MYRLTLSMLCVFCSVSFYGQQILSKIFLSDNSIDSILIKANHISFDKKCNYLFDVKIKEKNYFITPYDTIGPLKHSSTIYSTNGNVTYAYDENDQLYYFNPNDTKVYGPVKGKIDRVYTKDSYDYIIAAIVYKDSIYYYANGLLIDTQHKLNGHQPTSLNDWAMFSNGERIYIEKQKDLYRVITGGKIIAESKNSLSQPAINSKGDYLYVEGMKPPPGSRYTTYQFYIHTKDSVFGPVRTVWSSHINEDGSWFYTSDDDGPDYIVINNIMYRNIDTISNIILLDKNNYFFTYRKKGKQFYNHNGKEYELSFPDASDFIIDKKGNLSFYCKKDYYLYKVINGLLNKDPITNYGVRPFPVYISSTGVSTHCFITDDSMYLYRDNELIFSPESVDAHFERKDLQYEFPDPEKNNYKYGSPELQYFEWKDSGYVIYKDTRSKGMVPFADRWQTIEKEIGKIVGGSINENGFFIIQKTGDKKYSININNRQYKEVENITRLIPGFSFFEANKLTFYALQGKDFIQYTITF